MLGPLFSEGPTYVHHIIMFRQTPIDGYKRIYSPFILKNGNYVKGYKIIMSLNDNQIKQ